MIAPLELEELKKFLAEEQYAPPVEDEFGNLTDVRLTFHYRGFFNVWFL